MAKAGYRDKRIRPLWPIYASGVTFLIYSAFAPIYKTSHLAIACVLALAVYLLGTFKSPAKVEQVEVEVKTGDSDADGVIARGRETTARLRATLERITDPELKTYVARTERALTQMVDVVAQTPAKAAIVKRFINYYLPTIMKLLDAYDRLCEAGQAQTMNATLQSIEDSMENVARATERQLSNMFEDEQLDISTDIEVLETLLKSDGLLDDDPFDSREKTAEQRGDSRRN